MTPMVASVGRRAANSSAPRSRGRRYPNPASAAVTKSMKGNRRVDTSPEVTLRSRLHRAGLRFRKDYVVRFATGHTRADVCFPRLKVAVFIDGCFWHACPRHGTAPKHNAWYWSPKLRRNRERDARATAELRRSGWLVRRYWEHVPPARIAERVMRVLEVLRD